MPEMTNEELLRMGECSWPGCIEIAGHGGPHTGQRSTLSPTIERLERIRKTLPRDPSDGGRIPEAIELGRLIADLKAVKVLVEGWIENIHDWCDREGFRHLPVYLRGNVPPGVGKRVYLVEAPVETESDSA